MIEIYNCEMEVNKNRKFIKSITSENNSYIYFECLENEYLDFEYNSYKIKLINEKLEMLTQKKESEFLNIISFLGMNTRLRDKDVSIISSLCLIGGVYIFENGELNLTVEQAKELLLLVMTSKTSIIQRKNELEKIIYKLDLYDLKNFNVFCEW